MDYNYLIKTLIPQREKEIKEGENLSTVNPIYIVYDLIENVCSGFSDYSLTTNLKCKPMEQGYIDDWLYIEEREFKDNSDNMTTPIEVTRFWTDRLVAIFLTSKEAHYYLKYQSHNLNDPYVYVHSTGYKNIEMNKLLAGE
jgi:hypothetical protein